MASRIITQVVFNKFPVLTSQIKTGIMAVLRKTAFDCSGYVKDSFSGSKSGNVYQRGKKTHQASAPGEAPAVDTGNLMNAVTVDLGQINHLIADVTTGNVGYAEFLEKGTSRMAPRPFMEPGGDQVKDAFVAAMTAVVRDLG